MAQRTLYHQLCEQAQLEPMTHCGELQQFSSLQQLSDANLSQRVTYGLQALLHLVGNEQQVAMDRDLIDYYLVKIDDVLSEQLDQIMHHQAFQQLESRWRSLKYCIDHQPRASHGDIEILDVAQEELAKDFSQSVDLSASGLYKQVYIDEYDTPGGEPIAAIISDYEFKNTPQHINLLGQLAQLGRLAHCPFIGQVGPAFFNKQSMDDVLAIEDDAAYFERAEFIKWNQFRQRDEARYIGLTLPRFLLRLPYGDHHPIQGFHYQETIQSEAEDLLWGCASFPFAVNMLDAFHKTGWTVNIRGPESGGRVKDFPLHAVNYDTEMKTIIPTESLIPEAKELALSKLGFIPLCYYKHSDYGCFFSANSIQQPKTYHDVMATANARVNARLPYVFLVSRLGHYLKVLQRENIGSNKSSHELQRELNQWIQTLVTKMNLPTPDIIARYPLREATIEVKPIVDNPGYYHVVLHVIPHFQVEGVDVQLSLMTQMPAISEN